jgi:hypothetical protein
MVRGFMEDVTNLMIDGFAQMWDAPQRCNFNGTIYALRPWIYAVLYYQTQMTRLSGWWFGTWLLFFHSVGNVIIPTDEHILCMNTHHMIWILKDSIRNDGFASWSVGFSHITNMNPPWQWLVWISCFLRGTFHGQAPQSLMVFSTKRFDETIVELCQLSLAHLLVTLW